MALIQYWVSSARDGLKKQAPFIMKPFGLDLLSKEQTEACLSCYQIAVNPAAHIRLPGVADVANKAKRIFDQSDITTGPTHVWRVEQSSVEATLLRSGGLKMGDNVLNTDFGTSALFKDMFRPKKRFEHATTTLIAPWSHYWGRYYDYLFFVAAKLCRIKDALPEQVFAEATVAYPLLHTSFEHDLLALLGIRPENQVDSRTHTVRFTTAICGDNTSWFYPNPADVLSLRKHITARMPAQHGSLRRVYIRRSGRRRVINEEALIALLTKYDVDIIDDLPGSIAEQFAMYANASFIIGPHGASFANLLWCRPGTHLLELFAPDYAPEYFRYLAQLLGVRYSAYCQGTVRGSHHGHVDDDIVVSIDALERSLNDLFTHETVRSSDRIAG